MGKIKKVLLFLKNNWNKQNGFGDGDSSLWKPFIKKQQDNIDLASIYNTNNINNDIQDKKANINNPVIMENIQNNNKQNNINHINNKQNNQINSQPDKQNIQGNIFSVQPEDSIRFWEAAGVIIDPAKTDKKLKKAAKRAKRLEKKNNPQRPKNFFKRIL